MADDVKEERLPVDTAWISDDTRRLLALSFGLSPKEIEIHITAPAAAVIAMRKAKMEDRVLMLTRQDVEIILTDAVTQITVQYRKTPRVLS